MNKFLIVGRLWFLKAQLFLGDPIDLNGKLKNHITTAISAGNQFLVYDPDLEQVIVKELDSTFSSTPAGLLFASGQRPGTS